MAEQSYEYSRGRLTPQDLIGIFESRKLSEEARKHSFTHALCLIGLGVEPQDALLKAININLQTRRQKGSSIEIIRQILAGFEDDKFRALTNLSLTTLTTMKNPNMANSMAQLEAVKQTITAIPGEQANRIIRFCRDAVRGGKQIPKL